MRFALLASAIFALAVHASTGREPAGTLSGVVCESHGALVYGANVVIQSWKSDMKMSGRITYTINSVLATDGKGEFSLRLEEGRYDVFIAYPVCLPVSKRVKVEANKETKLEFELKEDPQIAGVVY